MARSGARLIQLLPALSAGLLFGVLGWWGSQGASPWYPDAGRHVLNGALIHDMISAGAWSQPVAYAREYYAHLPALSLGYHPPGFPLLEAVLFSITGVDYSAARLLVSITLCLSCLLLFRLVLRTNASPLLATAVVVCFLLTSFGLETAREVMLEFPSLVPALLAMHSLLNWDSAGKNARMRPALACGVWTAIAICTKQHWVLLVPLPALLLILRRRWRELWDPSLLLMTGIGAAGFAGVLAVMRAAGSTNTTWRKWPLHEIVLHHIGYYSKAIVSEVGLAGALVCAFVLAVQVYRRWRTPSDLPSDLYFAWFASAAGLLVLLRPWDSRYLFHLWPALLGLVLGSMPALPRPVGLATAAIFVVSFAVTAFPLRLHPNLYGHEQAARRALSVDPKRILYCGPHSGGFIYAVRKVEGRPQTVVIRADKLREDLSSSIPGLQKFAWEYGVDSIVIETGGACPDVNPDRWTSLLPLETVPVVGGEIENAGILVLQNRNVSPTPKTKLSLDSSLFQGGLDVDLKP